MKLELKHLAPYVACELQFTTISGKKRQVRFGTYGFEVLKPARHAMVSDHWMAISQGTFQRNYNPLLRPLSQLTEEIEHNGEKFVPMNKLVDLFPTRNYGSCCLKVITHRGFMFDMPLGFVEKIRSWHFDTEGLIERGLAIPKT